MIQAPIWCLKARCAYAVRQMRRGWAGRSRGDVRLPDCRRDSKHMASSGSTGGSRACKKAAKDGEMRMDGCHFKTWPQPSCDANGAKDVVCWSSFAAR